MKLNKYFSTLLGGLMLFGAWSCTDKIEPTPTPAFEGTDVYFSTTQSTDVSIPMDATEVSVTLYRVKADKEQTVDISTSFEMQDEAGNYVPVTDIFTAPETVTFTAGEKTLQIPVSVDFTKVEPGVDYYMTVKIEGDLTSSYGDGQKVFTLQYSEWTQWEWYDTPSTIVQWVVNGGLSDECEAGTLSPSELEASMDEDGDYSMLYYAGQIVKRTSLINDNVMMLGVGGPRYSNFHFNFILTIDNSTMVDVDGEQYPLVAMEPAECGYIYNDMEIIVSDCRTSLSSFFPPSDPNFQGNWDQLGLKDSYFNTKTGVIHLFAMEYTEAGNILSHDESFIYLPGYEDYTINFAYMGNFINKGGVENAVISISHGEDVASSVYGCKAGELTTEEVNAFAQELIDDTELELNYGPSYEVMLPLEENGTYTLVAVAYNQAGTAVGTSVFTFDFESVQKESLWKKLGVGGFSDDITTTMFKDAAIDTYEVAIEQHKETPGLYRIVDPFKDLYAINGIDPTGVPGYIYFNIEHPQACYILESPMGFSCKAYTGSDEELILIDQAEGMEPAEMIQMGCNGVLEDGVVTFPASFMSNGTEYPTLMFSYASLWEQGRGYRANKDGGTEIYMPDEYAAVAAKKAPAHKAKNLTLRTMTKAERGFLSVAKRKAAKKAKREAELKEFHNQILSNPKSIR